MRVEADVHKVFTDIDKNGNGLIEQNEVKGMLEHLAGHDLTDAEESTALEELKGCIKVGTAGIDFPAFKEWYHNCMFYKEHQKKIVNEAQQKMNAHKKKRQDRQDGKRTSAAALGSSMADLTEGDEEEEGPDGPPEDDDGGVSLTFPRTNRARVAWFLILPVQLPMFFTIPDVRWKRDKVDWTKFYAVTFFMSILWIAIFSCEYALWMDGDKGAERGGSGTRWGAGVRREGWSRAGN